MNGSRSAYILDARVVLGLMGGDSVILGRVDNISMTFITSTILGELYYVSLREQEQLISFSASRASEFLILEKVISPIGAARASFQEDFIIQSDRETSLYYAAIKNNLMQQFVNTGDESYCLPDNMLWIAASTIQYQQYGLILATRDQRFALIDGLNYEIW